VIVSGAEDDQSEDGGEGGSSKRTAGKKQKAIANETEDRQTENDGEMGGDGEVGDNSEAEGDGKEEKKETEKKPAVDLAKLTRTHRAHPSLLCRTTDINSQVLARSRLTNT
jgi:hypothetical protein